MDLYPVLNRSRLTASHSFPLGDPSPEEEAVSVGHLLKSGEDVDKRYHKINVIGEKRLNQNNVEENVREHNPTISTVSRGEQLHTNPQFPVTSSHQT